MRSKVENFKLQSWGKVLSRRKLRIALSLFWEIFGRKIYTKARNFSSSNRWRAGRERRECADKSARSIESKGKPRYRIFSLLCSPPVPTVTAVHFSRKAHVCGSCRHSCRESTWRRPPPRSAVAGAISNVNVSASARDFVNSLLFCGEGPNKLLLSIRSRTWNRDV